MCLALDTVHFSVDSMSYIKWAEDKKVLGPENNKTLMEYFLTLKLSRLESFRALKLSRLENFLTLKS